MREELLPRPLTRRKEGTATDRILFPGLAGNEHLKKKLAPAVTAEPPAVSHAYILEGPSGSGKRTLAKNLAAALVCEKRGMPGAALPCGDCLACRKIFRGTSPDYITVKPEDGKTGLGVDLIRDLRSDIHIYPSELEYKFYAVESADTMTVQAQNAFLLTLEEPPAYAVILLLCENASALLETVRSRAQTLRTEPLTRELTERTLLQIRPDAQAIRDRDPALFDAAVAASHGCPGRAAGLLSSAEGEEIARRRAAVEEFLRLAADRRRGAEAMSSLVSFCKGSREVLLPLLSDLGDAVRDFILLKQSESAELRFFTDREQAEEQADCFPIHRLLSLSDAVMRAGEAANRYMNVRLTLMTMLSDAGII